MSRHVDQIHREHATFEVCAAIPAGRQVWLLPTIALTVAVLTVAVLTATGITIGLGDA